MDLFPYLGNSKLNNFIYPNPLDSAGRFDPTGQVGSQGQQIYGCLGQKFKYSEAQAARVSDTTVGNLYNAEYQLVRISTGSLTLTDLVVGRPVFWSDKTKFEITPVASATALLAGVCICVLTSDNSKGDLMFIATKGDVGGLLKASSLTKASPLANDPTVLNIAASLATFDVLLDATGWTNVQLALRAGRVLEAWNGGAGTVKKLHLDNAYEVFGDGIR